MNFSNPVLKAEFTDWPSGGKRVPCVFKVEDGGNKGVRVSRTTTGKPKYSTYATKACIVTGDDGKTYILHHTNMYRAITVMRHDFMHEKTVFRDYSPEEYNRLLELIHEAR